MSRALSTHKSPVYVYVARVGYIDTDQGGIVHHSSYIRWLEHARTEFFRARGVNYKTIEFDVSCGFPVVDMHLRYKKSARFDDELAIETRVGELGRASLRFDYTVRCDQVILTEATVTLACIKLPEGRLSRLPDAIRLACTE